MTSAHSSQSHDSSVGLLLLASSVWWCLRRSRHCDHAGFGTYAIKRGRGIIKSQCLSSTGNEYSLWHLSASPVPLASRVHMLRVHIHAWGDASWLQVICVVGLLTRWARQLTTSILVWYQLLCPYEGTKITFVTQGNSQWHAAMSFVQTSLKQAQLPEEQES